MRNTGKERRYYSPESPNGYMSEWETLYPETPTEIDQVFATRKERSSHPDGKFDNGGRWYPSDGEVASCCRRVRSPSRAHPYSYMVHCRTRKHLQTWYDEHIATPVNAE